MSTMHKGSLKPKMTGLQQCQLIRYLRYDHVVLRTQKNKYVLLFDLSVCFVWAHKAWHKDAGATVYSYSTRGAIGADRFLFPKGKLK